MTMGGESMAVGPLTKYEKKTLSFVNADNVSNWNNGAIVPLSFEPKIVIWYGGPEEAGNVTSGVLVLITEAEVDTGVIKGLTGSGAVIGQNLMQSITASTGRYKIDNNMLYICRAAATSYWHSDVEYTFEIYG